MPELTLVENGLCWRIMSGVPRRLRLHQGLFIIQCSYIQGSVITLTPTLSLRELRGIGIEYFRYIHGI